MLGPNAFIRVLALLLGLYQLIQAAPQAGSASLPIVDLGYGVYQATSEVRIHCHI